MAYIFQSWSTAQVLTSAAQSQVEVNIRDHVHGVAGVASIPYRTLIPGTNAYIRDEFIGGIYGRPASGLCGELGWQANETYGVVGLTTKIAGHPGVLNLSSGASTNNYSSIQLTQINIDPADLFDAIFYFKVPSVTAVLFRFGIIDSNISAGTPTDGIYFEKLSTDTTWFAVSRASSTETRTNSGVTVAIDTWYKLRIRRIDASTIGYTVNSGSEITITTNIPTAGLCVGIGVRTTEAVNKYIHIDYFDMIVTGLTR